MFIFIMIESNNKSENIHQIEKSRPHLKEEDLESSFNLQKRELKYNSESCSLYIVI